MERAVHYWKKKIQDSGGKANVCLIGQKWHRHAHSVLSVHVNTNLVYAGGKQVAIRHDCDISLHNNIQTAIKINQSRAIMIYI